MRIFAGLRAGLAAGLLLLVMLAQPAFAHAQLLGTIPTDGALVDRPPSQLDLQFNEPVSPLAMRLIAPDGTATDLLEETTGGATVSIAMPAGMTEGTHVLSYRVVSADGHPIGGALVFSIGTVTDAATAPSSDMASSAALWIGKGLLFTCLFFGIGGAAFTALAPLPPPARRMALALSLAGLVIAPATLALQGLDALALPLSAGLDGSTWAAGLSTSYGLTVGMATLGFAVATLALLFPHSGFAIAGGLIAAGLATLAMTLSGHASAAAPQLLTRPMVFLHMGSLMLWIGALLPLWVLLRAPGDAAQAALAAFSRAIPYAIAPLLVSGATLAVIQMGAPGPAWLSPYGVILAAKLGLLIALFGLALWNRVRLTQPVLAGDAVASRRLRRSITAEVALVLVILALVAGWRFTPPPRALAAPAAPVVAAEPLLIHMMDDSTMVMATIAPGTAGPVTIDIEITDFEGMPIAAQAVTVTSSAPALGIEPIKREATETDMGWRIADLTIPVAGSWRIAVDVRIGRFELRKFDAEVDIP